MERLDLFCELLTRWNLKINLISKMTVPDIWHRHIADSAQIWELAPRAFGVWADLGSGAGLPGLVLAILAAEDHTGSRFILVESDVRKSVFLESAIRDCEVRANVVNARIEDIDAIGADVISARALAPLPKLLEFAEKHLNPEGICLFPKGERVHIEIEQAQRLWKFECLKHPSKTNAGSTILEIGALERD